MFILWPITSISDENTAIKTFLILLNDILKDSANFGTTQILVQETYSLYFFLSSQILFCKMTSISQTIFSDQFAYLQNYPTFSIIILQLCLQIPIKASQPFNQIKFIKLPYYIILIVPKISIFIKIFNFSNILLIVPNNMDIYLLNHFQLYNIFMILKVNHLIPFILIAFAAFITFYDMPADQYRSIYEQWKQEHQIQYNDLQDIYRYKIFIQNYEKVKKHNSQPNNQYLMGLSQFSALTPIQFRMKHLNYFGSSIQVKQVQEISSSEKVGDIDWVARGAVGPVKNMGQCSISAGFAATSTIQTLYWVVKGQLKTLSQQYLIDCCGLANPCNGGFSPLQSIYKCVKEKGYSTSYNPYSGRQENCSKPGDFFIGSYETVRGCDLISKKLTQNTLSVYVDATNWSMYRSGIFSNCGTIVNHVVTLVGQSATFWTIKNEWGSGWGEKGFIKLAKGNTCGVCISGVIPYKK